MAGSLETCSSFSLSYAFERYSLFYVLRTAKTTWRSLKNAKATHPSFTSERQLAELPNHFSMRHKASHAEVGDRQDSGSQLANRQDLGRIHCRTVGHTQNLPVEGSANIWTFSNKVLNNTEAEDVIGWTWVQPRREGTRGT